MNWSAGTASIRFTPEEPLWLAGYAVRNAPAQGQLSDLYVSAIALRDGAGETLLLASVDIIAVPIAVADAAAAIVRRSHPDLPRKNFVFAATHTHYAPEIRPDKALFFNIPPEYAAKIPPTADRLAQTIAEAMLRSLADLSPVRLYARRSIAGFAHNRRPHGDIIDPDVPILDIRHPNGRIKSILFGYACHNTTMDPHDLLYSSDWAGHAKHLLEQKHPGSTALFIPGCGADQNPDPRGTQALSLRYGAELADAVDRVLASPATEIAPTLRIAQDAAILEMQPVTPQWIAESLASSDPPRRVKAQYLQQRLQSGQTLATSYPAPMQAVRLGDEVLLLLLSGEPVIDWSHQFKREFASLFPFIWVAGYCNDMFGYLPTRRIQQEGGYEGGRATLWSSLPSPWTDDVEQQVSTTIRRLIQQVAKEHHGPS